MELTDQERKNREVVLQIEKLLKDFNTEPKSNESILVAATVKSMSPTEENEYDTFLANMGSMADLSFLFYNFIKRDPIAYAALRLAFLKLSEETNPSLINAVGQALKSKNQKP